MSTTTAIQSTPPDAANDRDVKGRFVRGNKGGPGNPLASQVNKVRKAFLEFFDSATMQVLCEFMLRKALSGDPRFLRIILQHTIGKLPSDDGFADFDAEAALAEAEAIAELSNLKTSKVMETSEVSPGDPQPVADPPSGLPTMAPDPASTVDVGNVPAADAALASALAAGVADAPNRPHSKKRECLLNLIEARDPLRGNGKDGDSWAGPPSTNGIGDARHVRLAGQ